MVARVALAAQKRADSSRPPVNLALLVDTSGSMEGRAIADARAASLALLDSPNVEVFDAVLHYADGVGGAAREERAFVGAKSTEDEASLAQGKDAAVGEAFERAKDAAATLEMLRMQREQAYPGRGLPAPSPSQGDFAAPAAPAPKAASGPARGPTSAALEAASPVERRRLHDRALRSLQAR